MIIGLSGKIGSGKDTFAEILIKYLDDINITAEKKSFAYKLKQIVALLTGTDISTQLSQEGKKVIDPIFNMSYGEMQQKIGTDAMRNGLIDDIWIKALFADYKEGNTWIISDVRFKNEAEAIFKKGGFLIRMEGDPSGVRTNSNRDLTHPSETDLDDFKDFHFIIHNDRDHGWTSMQQHAKYLAQLCFTKGKEII
jgi:hypothetical protein